MPITLVEEVPEGNVPERTNHREIADTLLQNPGKFVVLTYDKLRTAKSVKYQVIKGVLTAYQPAGSFTAEVRETEDGQAQVYVGVSKKTRVRKAS